MHTFGLGKLTGIKLPGEQPGLILPPSQYSGTSMYTLPFGQGESVTPIQMAEVYAAIANGGILRTPHIVQSIGGTSQPLPAGHRVISATTAGEIRNMLRGVLADGGTASGAAIPGYDLAGKTGTAQTVVDGKYSKTAFVASFMGMVPARIPSSSWRSSSTTRRATSTAAPSPDRRSRRSSAGRCRTSGSTRTRRASPGSDQCRGGSGAAPGADSAASRASRSSH